MSVVYKTQFRASGQSEAVISRSDSSFAY